MASHYFKLPAKKAFITVLLLCAIMSPSIAQVPVLSGHHHHADSTGHGCMIDLLLQQRKAANASFAEKHHQMDRNIREHMGIGDRELITIPVVVHIIHNNGPELISYAQILQGIEHLNLAFSNSGPFNSPDGVDTQIQFCLAKQDPWGSYTTGYTITQSPLTEVVAETQDAELKSLIQWDPDRYLNIWLVREITSTGMGTGIAGYAYFPSSQGQPEDGIVNEAALFGSTYDNSKVHIHEAGHYLGLYHTFEGGCINNDCMEDGDHVCDTPPDNSTASVMCNAAPNTCTSDDDDTSDNNPFRPTGLGGLGDQPDMIENYMDYGYQFCQTHFSEGQANRMQAVMASERYVLQLSNACSDPCPYQLPVTIAVDTNTIEVGDALTFIATAPNAIGYIWWINGIPVGSFDTFTYTFETTGIYEVKVVTSYNFTNCNETASVLVEVLCTAQAGFTMASTNTYGIETEVATNNNSIGADDYEWYLDGQLVTTDELWAETFSNFGSHRIYLVASDQTCSDTSSTIFFQVGDCDYSRVTANWSLPGQNLYFPEEGSPYISGTNSMATNFSWQECSSSISDAEGNLLFYTDGIHVWDKNNNMMPNGDDLMSHWSATQGMIIVPHPGNTNQFYIFTNDAVENNFANGTRYSIVDITLNNGLGDVIESSKNTLLFENGTEKLTATWHADGHSVWVASGTRLSNEYFAFLIDGDGVHPDPVVSALGTSNVSDLGSMKFSHDGNRMAAAVISSWPWRVLVADFDPSTGIFSNDFEIPLSSLFNEQIVGLQFSPDNSKLYTTEIQGGQLIQYDLSLTTPSLVAASKYEVVPYIYGYGHIELGLNGMLYVTDFVAQSLDAIQFPNLPGALCGFQDNVLTGLASDMYTPWVLPNMLQGYQQPHNPSIAGPLNICADGNEHEYSILFLTEQDSAIWSHWGPASFSFDENVCTLTTGNEEGMDTLSVVLYGRCGISYDTLIVQTNLPGPDPLPEEIFYCNTPITLSPGNNYLTYYWMDEYNTPYYVADEPGTYWVELKETTGCIILDTVQISTYPALPSLSLGPDITICQGGIGILEPTLDYPEYQWQNGMTSPSITVYSAGVYWLTVSDGCSFSDTDSINVLMSIPTLDLNYNGEDTLCDDVLPLNINAPGGFTIYEWSNGDTDATTTLTTTGTYDLIATNAAGCFARDTMWVFLCENILSPEENIISIYPNPASDRLHINWGAGNTTAFVIFNSLGKMVYSSKENTNTQATINISSWADGIYTLQILDDQPKKNFKFIVAKGG